LAENVRINEKQVPRFSKATKGYKLTDFLIKPSPEAAEERREGGLKANECEMIICKTTWVIELSRKFTGL
jgi:hypothetical protein